jgi:hypothetical protein
MMIASGNRSALFLALVGWAGAGVLFMLFVYVPTHTPLTTAQAIIAWSSVSVALVAGVMAIAKSATALRGRARVAEHTIAIALAVPPCVLAGVVAVALISSS